jgi:bifunctional DNA-binding transcriptional regulator/antitoxin component of YhaV-PrlF toxin-antitoxin module
MKDKGVWLENRCLGSTTIGPRGQAVILVNARKELGIDAGTTLLVFKALGGQGLVLLKVDAIEQMMSMVSQRLTDFEKLVKDYKSPKAASGRGIDYE